MPSVSPEKIRNVALVGHGGAGKTTLAEALLHAPARRPPGPGRGRDDRQRLRPRGEVARHARSTLSVLPFEWKGHKVNLIDTPGYADFVGEVHAALRVADLAVFVVSARSRASRSAPRRRGGWRPSSACPAWCSSTSSTASGPTSSARSTSCASGSAPASRPSSCPIGEEAAFRGVADLLTDTAWSTTAARPTHGDDPRRHGGARARGPRQPGRGDRRRRRRAAWSATSRATPRRSRSSSTRSPSAWTRPRCSRSCAARRTAEVAIDRLADFICEIGPSPLDRPPVAVQAGDDDVGGAADAVGRAAGVRVQDRRRPVRRPGHVVQGAVGHDPARRPPRQLAHRHRRAAPRPVHDAGQGAATVDAEVPAGDLGAVAKLADTVTGDTLAPKGTPVRGPARSSRPSRCSPSRSRPHPGRRGQAADGAPPPPGRGPGAPRRARRRDPPDPAARAWARRTSRSSLERLAPQVRGRGRHRGRAGPLPRDDHRPGRAPRASTRSRPAATASSACAPSASSPLERGRRLPSSSTRSSAARSPASSSPRSRRASPRRWRRAGLRLPRGRRARSTLLDGKYHSVDSSEMAFKMAGRIGVPRGAWPRRRPCMLEPVSHARGHGAGGTQGDVHGRPQRPARPGAGHRGGRRAASRSSPRWCRRPSSCATPIDLRSMTGGRGRFTVRHDHYDVLPAHLVDKVRQDQPAS